MNPVQNAILGRRSVRSFLPRPLSVPELDALTAAALASPSSMDRQPWQFHFVTRPEVRSLLAEAALDGFRAQGNQGAVDRIVSRGGDLLYGAPLVVLISLPRDADGMNWADVGIAAQTLALAATGLGLGSCIVAMVRAAFDGPRGEEVRRAVDLDSGRDFALAVVIGEAAAGKDAHPVHPEKVVRVE